MKCCLSLMLGLCLTLPLWAWNAPGHCVIALIAYDKLTPVAKTKVDALVQALPAMPGGSRDICAAANWADNIRSQQINAFTTWHYVNQRLRLSEKSRRKYVISSPNVVWAINQAEIVLMSPNAQTYEQAWFIRFFLHFVGDIHQPLHTVSLFNERFPQGDKGGNLYLIQSPIADNLHSLWDQGVGLVPDSMSMRQIRALAKQLQLQNPPSYFGAQIHVQNPWVWANEGYRISKAEVYRVPYGGTPDQTYISRGQAIAAARLTLAGYRLGYLLNLWAAGTLVPTQ